MVSDLDGRTVKTLLLLRHAKSSWDDASLDDHERPLNRRGREAARRIGAHLAAGADPPTLALCSTARRARETLDAVVAALPSGLPVEIDADLYMASPSGIMQRIAAAPEDCSSLLVVGHNPGIGELAARLAKTGPGPLRERLRRKFPTAALARLRLGEGGWEDFQRGAQLVEFAVPGELGP
jgi:phosphohistidine phosphatase